MRTSTLGQVCREGGGSIQTGPFGSQLKASSYVMSGIPTVMPADLVDYRISEASIARVGPKDYERLARHILMPGDIVYGRRGDIGRHALVTEKERGWLCGTGCLRIRFGKASVEPRYVSYYLRQGPVIDLILARAVGTTLPNLNTEILSSTPINLPPLSVQRQIAQILGLLDDRIEVNRRISSTLESMAQALYKHWFVDFGPVVAKAEGREPWGMNREVTALFPERFVNGGESRLPEGWSMGRLSDIARIEMGASPPGTSYNDRAIGVPLINGPAEFGPDFPVKSKWTTAPTRLSRPGDLIFCVRGSTTGRRVVADDTYCLGRGVCAIRTLGGYQEYVNQTIDFNLDRLLSKTGGSVFPNLSSSDLNSFDVLIPSAHVLDAYSHIVQPFVRKIESNVRESATLGAIRDYLLPRLLSGEISVGEVEEIL